MNRFLRTKASRAGLLIAAASLPAVVVPGTALAAHGVPPSAATSPARAVPASFRATSLTWTSKQDGWVLGTARCGGKSCTEVIATTDAGKTWKLRGTVPAPIAQIGNPGSGVTQIRFGTSKAGWSYRPGLYRTFNSGRSWAHQRIPGNGQQILDLAATATSTYAIVSPCKFASGLCGGKPLSFWRTSTSARRPWTKIALTLPANNAADVAVHGKTVYVIDAQRDVNGRKDKFYASTNGGRRFGSRPVPCDKQPDVALIQAVATSAAHVALLCLGNLGSPQPGNSTKIAYRSTDTGKTDTSAGTMPSLGTTAQLAASPSGHLAAESSSGGSFIYINNAVSRWRTSVFFGDGGKGWNDIVYLTDSVGWIVYSPASYFHGSGKLYSTRDAGRHWHLVAP